MDNMEHEHTVKKRRSRGEDYVNNKEFSQALSEYVAGVKEDIAEGKEPRLLTKYIGECFLKICYGLSKSPNFMSYTYRDDMVMDAVENCMKAVNNYNFDAPTRTGNANGFSYFTQIAYYAFLRRIAKEKKQLEIKKSLIEKGNIGNFAAFDGNAENGDESMIERMRQKNDAFYNYDNEERSIAENAKIKKVDKRKYTSNRKGLLDEFLDA